MKFLFALVAFAAWPLLAQAPPWEVGLQFVPTTTAKLVTQTVHVQQMTLVNTSGSAVTVTVSDLTTNCSSAACSLFSASIPANTTYTVSLGGARAQSGVSWSASAGSAVVGWLKGTF
jgi:hypothetical protein